MRDMATTIEINRKNARRMRRMVRLRIWVQTAFLAVWLAPMGKAVQSMPSCVYHCYACPLASFACPIGVIANFSAWHAFPFLAVGVLVIVAGLLGSLVCGWACPFGFLQDLTAKIPVRKFRIPNWMGYGRYLVLIGLVILVPYFWGKAHPLFICRVCPAGGVEAGLTRMIMGLTTDAPEVWLSTGKWIIVPVFLLAAVITYRPWCKIFCPLGGFLALFNRFSVFRLRFEPDACTECNTCRSRCEMGVHVEKAVNTGGCIRCLECTTCGAIKPQFGKNTRAKE